jgi:hypothetical protein
VLRVDAVKLAPMVKFHFTQQDVGALELSALSDAKLWDLSQPNFWSYPLPLNQQPAFVLFGGRAILTGQPSDNISVVQGGMNKVTVTKLHTSKYNAAALLLHNGVNVSVSDE